MKLLRLTVGHSKSDRLRKYDTVADNVELCSFRNGVLLALINNDNLHEQIKYTVDTHQ